MKFLFKFIIFCFTLSSFSQLDKENQQKIKKAEEFILDKETDSAAFYLNQLEENNYTKLLNKLNNKEYVSYQEYDEFLNSVSDKQSIRYQLISNFINEKVKEPESSKKIDADYVNIKWIQVGKLRDEVTLEAANVVQKQFERYVNKFSEDDLDVRIAKLRLDTHTIVMYDIKRDLTGKKLCLEALKKAKAINNVRLQMTFLYHLSDFYTTERKLKEFIETCEEGIMLGKSINKESNYYYALLENLIDGYIFKGGEYEKILKILGELYDYEPSRLASYNYFLRVIRRLDKKSPYVTQILNQFNAKNILELVEKFKVLVKDLNQHDYSRFLKTSAVVLVMYEYYREGINYKNEEVKIVKNIYSEDLSETLASYKTEQAVKEKDLEITIQKERAQIYILAAILIGVFLLITLFILRKVKLQSNLLKEKNSFISKTLKEKELLVREVHHRVKNNFQIVSSLLELQSKGIEDEKALELANEGKTRVKSMALIHQKLYQDKSGLVDFDEYIQLLVKELTSLYDSKNKITTNISSKGMKFDVDTAIPLGLIINEIITNSYKYAFTDGKENLLSVSIDKNTEHEYRLIIEDNGPGISETLDITKAKSLGLRLINRLVKQLHGKLDVTNKNGARFEILFKDLHARQLVN